MRAYFSLACFFVKLTPDCFQATMSSAHSCRGCAKSFKRDSDRTRHLRNTKDPRCLVVAQEEFSYVPQPQQDVEIDDEASATTWNGDFFGARSEYHEADFPMNIDEVPPQPDNSQTSPKAGPSRFAGAFSDSDEDETEPPMPEIEEMEDSDDEDSSSDDESDIGEINPADIARLVDQVAAFSAPNSPATSPPPSPSYSNILPSSSSTSSFDDLAEEFGRLLDEQELHTLHEHLVSKPVIESFPLRLGRPGAPISRNHRHSYEKSRDALDEAGDGNPYSPMCSQLEWDFAKWAKLRGPSATALTELLKIDGVSLSFMFLYDHVSLAHNFASFVNV